MPTLNLRVPVPAQHEHLDQWLWEWELDRVLTDPQEQDACASAGQEPLLSGAPGLSAVEPEASSLRSGQIRLLRPGLAGVMSQRHPAADRLRFFAVLGPEHCPQLLLIPFSRFASPAFPAELLLGREPACMRVLCVWNSWQIVPDMARASWLVDELEAGEVRDVLAVLSHHEHGTALPARLSERVGPGCWHPADPRKMYKRREAGVWREVLEGFCPDAGSLPLAAEEPGPYEK